MTGAPPYLKDHYSVESYQLTMQYLFSDDICNLGWVKVWFYVTQNVYKRLPGHERSTERS